MILDRGNKMNNQDYWKRFVKTGNIYDYLNYTACTREDRYRSSAVIVKEGEQGSGNDKSDRNGPVFDAHR